MIDPVCLLHGKKQSEHLEGFCLYCCICFKELKREECAIDSAGQAWDVCGECGIREVGGASV